MNHASSYASRFSSTRRQQGNTLVGIIIGLVIGLGIAVVVALVITKGASPFTDKSGKAGKSTEPTAGQIADPNKPMYGNKEAAKEAARDFSKEPREIVTPTQPAAPAPAPAQQPKAPPPDALQELIGTLKDKPAPKTPAAAPAAPQAKADVKEAKADAASDKWIYYLQAGAFHDMSDAESTRGKLALLGFEAAISDRSTDAGVLHRVRVGPFNQLEAMNRARTKLSENGIDVAVVRNQK
ncbi:MULTISPECIES: SPOR domain-containing protein [Janthinobacterium]|uniref:SPOR domain-containing protein n=1 Tax=Janthinobacterium rivuli TaxID=2751478 RepID=A0ABY8I6F3_9BURK|nr:MULTISPECIES: SPOR domain-containing protein [Janthinobacterium]MBW3511781.1 SPOR domain-containing protein [Janthinobacterium sp. NKUCC06_STL]MCA1863617.1 SPOR domain-containing protein [Janthinobacterium lividum]PHV31442.1 cell division protein [Janthinobacterium sp. BJB312]WFR80500.1 SPOR domain-containing protein [Janthinobacterium rivuli]